MTTLNGWTAERLYDLKRQVDSTHDKVVEIEADLGEIKGTLRQMQSEETQSLRDQVKELRERPRLQMHAVLVPFLCACIPAVVILVTHA